MRGQTILEPPFFHAIMITLPSFSMHAWQLDKCTNIIHNKEVSDIHIGTIGRKVFAFCTTEVRIPSRLVMVK